MTKALEGRTALVTGAASGIGRGIVEGFVNEGARVIAVDLAEERLLAAYPQSPEVTCLVQDISEDDAPKMLAAQAIAQFGGLDILVNNAGIAGDLVELHLTTDEMWRKVMSTNLDPVFRITREFVPILARSSAPRVINTGSVCSMFAIPLVGTYAASKHAILGLTKSYAIELGKFKITVNCLMPGNTVTGITEAFYPDPETDTGKAFLEGTNVLGRYSYPPDIAAAAIYLASDGASYVTGQALGIDGGMTARMPSLPI